MAGDDAGAGRAASTDWVKSACAVERLGVHSKMLSQSPANSIAYSPGPFITFATLYLGDGSVSSVLGPDVLISESELVSTVYFECSVIQELTFDHFASQSAPARHVITFGDSVTDACCSAVMQPLSAIAHTAATKRRTTVIAAPINPTAPRPGGRICSAQCARIGTCNALRAESRHVLPSRHTDRNGLDQAGAGPVLRTAGCRPDRWERTLTSSPT